MNQGRYVFSCLLFYFLFVCLFCFVFCFVKNSLLQQFVVSVMCITCYLVTAITFSVQWMCMHVCFYVYVAIFLWLYHHLYFKNCYICNTHMIKKNQFGNEKWNNANNHGGGSRLNWIQLVQMGEGVKILHICSYWWPIHIFD